MKNRILLVEDEESLANTIKLNLELDGYDVTRAADGEKALDFFSQARFDLIILDIMLPKINGLDVCQRIRQENRQVMILFLSARNMSSERIEGLRAGADDYLDKPFHLDELLLRVEILLKRIPGTAQSTEEFMEFSFGGHHVNFDKYQFINSAGEEFKLTKKEAALLKLLAQNKNKATPRETILEKVWGYDNFPTVRTIDNFIMNFRKFVNDDPKNPRHFISVRGIGYMLKE
jgi:two-component system, OmpR family, alkaline phosphatase synthesis response regulator PhoP